MSIQEMANAGAESAIESKTPPVASEMRFYKIAMPTEPGWWWYKEETGLGYTAAHPVRVYLSDVLRRQDTNTAISKTNGQWYGPPIPQPEKTP